MNAKTGPLQWSVVEILQKADPTDLGILVDYLTDRGEGRISVDEAICIRLVRCKERGKFNKDDRALILKEFRLFGGNSLVNFFRGEGVSYSEILRDVANHLSIVSSKYLDDVIIEKHIIRTLFGKAFDSMSEVEKEKILRAFKVKGKANAGGASAASIQFGAQLSGFAMYKMSLIVANALAKTLIGRGISLVGNAAITRALGFATGPVGWAVTGVWTLADLASPAYRVTIPCVAQIAYIRQKLARRAVTKKAATKSSAAKQTTVVGTAVRKIPVKKASAKSPSINRTGSMVTRRSTGVATTKRKVA